MPTPTGLGFVPNSCVAGTRAISHVDLAPLAELPFATDGTKPFLHVLVNDQTRKWSSQGIHAHVTHGSLPSESLFAISPEIIVASPELTLLQLARSARLLPCIEMACEWCGSYALAPGEDSCRYGCIPITDLTRLDRLLAHAPALRGSSAVRKIVEFTGERLASPRETECFLMLILSNRLGGFALPSPLVNQQIPLDLAPFGVTSRHRFYLVDFFWPDARLIVEYDGFEDHEASAEQVAADKERRSVLAALGYTVIVITKRDLESLSAFEHKVGQIAFALGVELNHLQGEEYAGARAARKALFAWLFDCRHDHLPLGFGFR